MAGLLGALNSAKSGMSVSQTSIETTSHNVSNINTPGYTRQRVQQSAKSAYSNPGLNSRISAGQIGTGSEATDIIRIRNTFYDYQYRNESHNYGQISIKYQYYTNMETIFNEPSDTSISASIGNFFSSCQELAKNPTDAGAKDIMIQNSKYLANNISNIKNKLDNLEEQAQKKINEDIEEVNSMLKLLKEIDKQIKVVESSGKTPNDLMDKRDSIIDNLSSKMDLNNETVKKILENGQLERNELEITTDDVDLINNEMDYLKNLQDSIDNVNKLIVNNENNILKTQEYIKQNPNDEDAQKTLLQYEKDGEVLTNEKNEINEKKQEKTNKLDETLNKLIDRLDLDKENVLEALKDGHLEIKEIKIPNKSGEIQASYDMINKIKEFTNSLVELSEGIATNMNNILKEGGSSTWQLFIFNKDSNSILTVNEDLVNISKNFEITTETALEMYNIKNKKIIIGSDNATIEQFYNQIIQKLGNESQEIIRQESNQSKIIEEIDNIRLNVSGVSLEEEMVSLVQFQHSYNASAKVVSTIDSLLDVVINGLMR